MRSCGGAVQGIKEVPLLLPPASLPDHSNEEDNDDEGGPQKYIPMLIQANENITTGRTMGLCSSTVDHTSHYQMIYLRPSPRLVVSFLILLCAVSRFQQRMY